MRRPVALISTLALFVAASSASADQSFKEVSFSTKGGIQAEADLYVPAEGSPTLIILFHQAGWSRGEYREIAPKLVARGYRVLAVDQRSGKGVNGVRNETHLRASRKKLPTSYQDAYADLEAALAFAKKSLKPERIIVWGSSYSASLVFKLAAAHPTDIHAVLAFSPGEYFRKRHGGDYIRGFAKRVEAPVFVTSAKSERERVKPIYDAVPAERKILFTPASLGQHGSRALWDKWMDSDVYWTAVSGFLAEYAPPSIAD